MIVKKKTLNIFFQKKKIIKASESYPIKLCTVDRGEPCHVKHINIPEYRKCITTDYYPILENISKCSSNSALIKYNCCYDAVE